MVERGNHMVKTSIIIFAQGREQQLSSCLWSIETFTPKESYELIVVGKELQLEENIHTKIKYFEIKDNPNISLNLSNVCDLIKEGRYLLIYDPEQDIRGCDYLKE